MKQHNFIVIKTEWLAPFLVLRHSTNRARSNFRQTVKISEAQQQKQLFFNVEQKKAGHHSLMFTLYLTPVVGVEKLSTKRWLKI